MNLELLKILQDKAKAEQRNGSRFHAEFKAGVLSLLVMTDILTGYRKEGE